MEILTLRTEGLGDSSYILTHDGVAVVVDPQRDIDRFETELGSLDLRAVVETHVHNDYISGGRDLATRHDAEVFFPAAAAPVFRHRPAFHMEPIDLGAISLMPIHTPGHTPEHTSYVVKIDGRVEAVFSGGCLLVGSAGRSDLLGEDRAESLARLQFGSVHRLAALPGHTTLYPTHGAGSFCTASQAGAHTSTIGAEISSNPVLAYPDEDSFVRGQLDGLVPFPAYYAHMGPANIAGRSAVTGFPYRVVSETEFEQMEDGVAVIDARPSAAFASGHLPGSLAIRLRKDFGVWCGWVLPFDQPLVLVMDPAQDPAEAIRQLSRIGFDRVLGVVLDLPSWDRPLDSLRTVDVEEFAIAVANGEQIVDTRAPNEWATVSIPDSIPAYVPELLDGPPSDLDPDREVWVLCESGYRATIAASLLESRGIRPLVLTRGGVTEVLARVSNTGDTR